MAESEKLLPDTFYAKAVAAVARTGSLCYAIEERTNAHFYISSGLLNDYFRKLEQQGQKAQVPITLIRDRGLFRSKIKIYMDSQVVGEFYGKCGGGREMSYAAVAQAYS